MVSKFLFSPSRKSIVCRYVFFLLFLDCGIKKFYMRKSGADAAKTAAACPRSDLRDTVGSPAANERARLACVPSGGRERCVQTHGRALKRRNTVLFLLLQPKFCAAPGGHAATDRCWTERRRERENAPDRKDSRHSSSPSVVKRGWVGFPLFPACVWPVEN